MKRLWFGLMLVSSVLAEEPLSIRLIAENQSIAPGETIEVGLHLKPDPGFHTYWKHPGIVGVATSVEWNLPAGFTAGEIRWPMPQLVSMAGHVAQGYRGETLLMVPITAPRELAESSVTLTARVSWMCCGRRCHPGVDVPFSITLPVGGAGGMNPETRPMFERFRTLIPQVDPAWTAEFERRDGSILLTLSSADPERTREVSELGEPRFFTADGQVDSDGEQKVTRGPGAVIRIELPVSEHEQSARPPRGVVIAEKSWRKDGGSVALELR